MFVLVLADLEQANVILDFQYEWGVEGGGGGGGSCFRTIFTES